MSINVSSRDIFVEFKFEFKVFWIVELCRNICFRTKSLNRKKLYENNFNEPNIIAQGTAESVAPMKPAGLSLES